MNNPISDQQQRMQALNPQQSFIVQAPAGSGKTELLTQRYLVLLTQVEHPEAIVAVTFTRKAAAEMRTRILEALQLGTETHPPQTPHAQQRWELAKKVLAHQANYSWDLLANPNRLRILTIDALCTSLTRQMPISSQFGAQPEISNNPALLYDLATQEVLTGLENDAPWSAALATLFLHLDNDYTKVQKLLSDMLKNREQWLPHIINNNLKNTLESNLQQVRTDVLTKIKTSFASFYDTLYPLIVFANHNLNQEIHAITSDEFWLNLPSFLLTKENNWRKAIRINEGFPPPSRSKDPQERSLLSEMKQNMEALLAELAEQDDLKNLLIDLRELPPSNYNDAQWKILTALRELLLVLAAQLTLTFQQYNQVDYSEIAQRALKALGDPENPTDLALALDYQIQHLLVDEFQDTSVVQLKLIEQLTAGWQPHDNHTLFLVGDPMQSIYRFRKAEVGLFLQVRQYGINHIRLEPLVLNVNFRSTPTIVNWVNQKFSALLPQQEDISAGAISYSASTANQYEIDNTTVQYHWLTNADHNDEAKHISRLIQSILKDNPKTRIAVLVRARPHLYKILTALKAAKIPYRAVEIDKLAEQPLIQDLLALTRALLHPGDRIAWLAILRAPWCGLTLQDLHILTQQNLATTIFDQLIHFQNIALTNDGKQRLERIVPVLQQAMLQRDRQPLTQWLENTWLALGGPACIEDTDELNDVKTFFTLIEQVQIGNNIIDFSELETQLAKLYAAAHAHTNIQVEVMTIFKSKGLEFDTVILPGLDRSIQTDESQLMLYMERPTQQNTAALLLAPIKASDDEYDPIYNYLSYEEKKKAAYEIKRLLYVATTRAKKTLHLTALLKKDNDTLKSPAQNCLLGHLWPALETEAAANLINCNNLKTSIETEPQILKRLALNWQQPLALEYFYPTTSEPSNVNYQYQWQNNYLPQLGTVIHLLLRQITQPNFIFNKIHIRNLLLQHGITLNNIDTAIVTVETALKQIQHSTRGRWILDNQHLDAYSEYPLTTHANGKIQQIIIDRTFVDNNIRWIIDYKTGSPTDNDMEQYHQQLEHYAKIFSTLDTKPIHLGLYFPLTDHWYEWKFNG